MSLDWQFEQFIENLAEENNVSIEQIKENLTDFIDDVYYND